MQDDVKFVNFRVPREVWKRWLERKAELGQADVKNEPWLMSIMEAWYESCAPVYRQPPKGYEEVDRKLLEAFIDIARDPRDDLDRSLLAMVRTFHKTRRK